MSCLWPVSYSACKTDAETGEALCFEDPAAQSFFEEMAVGFLRNWTGRSLGLCETVVRPCRRDCGEPSTFEGRGPRVGWARVSIDGDLFPVRCGACLSDACGCTTVPSLKLPGPVHSIVSIDIDGVILDPTTYRVDDWSYLVRMDGAGWPVCQDFAALPGMPGTWEVSYLRGREVPLGGQIAAGILACELSKAACRDRECQLPERIQNITRQGVTVTLMDDFKTLQEGLTGIWLIDSWITSVTKPKQGGVVMSPDVRRNKMRKTTWVAPPVEV